MFTHQTIPMSELSFFWLWPINGPYGLGYDEQAAGLQAVFKEKIKQD